MAYDSNKLMTFTDLQALVNNELFFEKDPISASNRVATIADALSHLHISDSISNVINNLPSNRLVRRDLLVPRQTAWIGDENNIECLQVVVPPVNLKPSAPVISLDYVVSTAISIDWTASVDPEGNLAGYNIILEELFIEALGTSYQVIRNFEVGADTLNTIFGGLRQQWSYRITVRGFDDKGLFSDADVFTQVTATPDSGQIPLTIISTRQGDSSFAYVNADIGTVINWKLTVTNESDDWYVKTAYDSSQKIDNLNCSAPPDYVWTGTRTVSAAHGEELILIGKSLQTGFFNPDHGRVDAIFEVTSASGYSTMPPSETFLVKH